MTDEDVELELEELSSAEDFLDYFGIDYDPAVVQVNRLHILQRFHDYLAGAAETPANSAEPGTLRADLLSRAYQDFVTSDAASEKVFRVFHRHEPRTATVDLSDLVNEIGHAS